MPRYKTSTNADIFLGKKLEALRNRQELTRMQLGKKVNITYQQLEKYENGTDRIPAPMLETLWEALNAPIPKKIIRRIIFLRKLEQEKEEEQEELITLYQEIVEDE